MGEDECFPRGGTAPRLVKSKNLLEPDLFKTDKPKTAQVSKKPKLGSRAEKQARLLKRRKKIQSSQETSLPNSTVCTSLKAMMLTPEMLLLGSVKNVDDYHLDVCLSNGLVGRVSIAHISDAYTHLLQRLTDGSTDDGLEELGKLSDLFCVSSIVRCRLISCDLKAKGSRRFSLSIDPRDVNRNLSTTTLHTGLVLSGSVQSREDHGYIIDLGIAHTTAFLKTKDAESYVSQCNGGRPLKIGSYLTCRVQNVNKSSAERRTVTVSVDPQIVNKSTVSSSMNITMHHLLPGMVVEATVAKVTNTGVTVSFLSYKGSIISSHLQKSTKSLTLGDTVLAAILYIQPQTKEVSLTALSHLVNAATTPHKQFGNVERGDIFTNASVCQIEAKRGITVRLKTTPKLKAFARVTHLSDGQLNNISSTFAIKSTHKCRVIDFDYTDNVAVVTLKKSLIEQKYLGYGDMKPGMVVTGAVCHIGVRNVYVRLSSFVSGFIPLIHLSDSPHTDPQRRYTVGKVVTAKVLTVDISNRRLVLTAKKSLIRSKFTDVIKYDASLVGTTIQGFITNVGDNGVLVKFYSNVKGWVHRSELSFEDIEFPQTVFYKGQVVKCHVLKCVPEEQRLLLSFKKEGLARFGTKTVELPESFALGKLVDCVIKQCTNDGFNVELTSSKLPAYISKVHLSDFSDIAELLWKTYKAGDMIQQAMFIGSKAGILLTKKNCLIQSAKNGSLVSELADLKVGQVLPVVVTGVAKFGVFVSHVEGISGLVHKKYFGKGEDMDPSTLFTVGQSCMAKVHQVEKEKLSFSFRIPKDAQDDDDDDDGVGLLEEYLKEREIALTTSGAMESEISLLHPGHLVTAHVTDIDDNGVCCEVSLPSCTVRGFATRAHMGRMKCAVGDDILAVVLHADVATRCLQLSLDTALKKIVKNRKENALSKVKICQRIKCTVQLIKPNFVLVSLKGHASGSFAYLPVRKNLTDEMHNQLLMIGQDCHVIIASVKSKWIIATVMSREKMRHTKMLGTVVLARIVEINEQQMNVVVGQQRGRVVASEISDEVLEGTNALSSFVVGSAVHVKIIGLNEDAESMNLKPNAKKLKAPFLECSLRPSVISREEKPVQSLKRDHIATTSNGQVSETRTSKKRRTDSSESAVNEVNGTSSKQPKEKSADTKIKDELTSEDSVLKLEVDTPLTPEDECTLLPAPSTLDERDKEVTQTKAPKKRKRDSTGIEVNSLASKQPKEKSKDTKVKEAPPVKRDKTTADSVSTLEVDVAVTSTPSTLVEKSENDAELPTKGKTPKKRQRDSIESAENEVKEQTEEVTVKKVKKDKVTPTKAKTNSTNADDKGRDTEQKLSAGIKGANTEPVIVDVDEKAVSIEPLQGETPANKMAAVHRLEVDVPFAWDTEFKLPVPSTVDDESESEEEEEKAPKVKLTREQKRAADREEDKKLFKTESDLLDTERTPGSAADFDRLALESPDSSLVWLRYMTFYLEMAEVEKARGIAERALKTISFREEQEKLNVWMAYLNLENLYGTAESLSAVLQRALQANDPASVYRQLIAIYMRSDKTQAAEQIHCTMVKRFNTDITVWCEFGQFYYKTARPELARKLMQRALLSLDQKNHVNLLGRFAQMEMKLGDLERGRTMFEKVLASYPKRTDLWSVYIDLQTKLGEAEPVRKLFERVIQLPLSALKMKLFFKKYLDFEQKHGTAEQVDDVKRKAVAYVEAKTS